MKISKHELSPRKVIASVSLVCASFAISACDGGGHPSTPPGEGHFEKNQFVKEVTSGNDSDFIRIYCDGYNLIKKLDDKKEQDNTYQYNNHPACEDMVLDPSDDFSRDVFENEYSRYTTR